MFKISTPLHFDKVFTGIIWDIPTEEKKIYLTFDDGPTPEVTPWVLSVLKQHNIKATFFCIANNVRKHPDLFQKTTDNGHSIGNHTYNHLNGWKTSNKEYYRDIEEAGKLINSTLFRPPYGKIKLSQAIRLKRKKLKIVMWNVLSRDFDPDLSGEECLKNVLANTKPGSIIVFHDSLKAFENLEYTLPKLIEYYKQKGYKFGIID